MTRRPGRPTRIVGDVSDLHGAAVDLRTRVAWLARVSRCASSNPHAATQVTFAEQLREVGVNASSTKVSLWENAHQPMTLAVLAGYEQVLGLAPAQLQATCEGLSRSISSAGRPPLQRARGLRGGQELLDTAYDAASQQTTNGGDWFTLTSYWDHMRSTMIPLAIVRQLTRALLGEMVRSCGVAYVTRFQALCHLADHPVYAQVLVDAIRDLIAVPGVEPVIDAISLMGEGLPEQTAPVLLGLATDPSGRVRAGSVAALTNQLRMGVFPSALLPRLRQLVGALCAGSLEDARLARQLIVRMAPPDQQDGLRLLRRRTPSGPGAARVRTSLPPPVAAADFVRFERAAQAATGLPQDPVLHRLLHEVHVHDRAELRHHACLLLMASPYRSALASVALEVLVEQVGTASAVSAAIVLSYLATPDQDQALVALLADPRAEVRRPALTALTHATGVPHEVDLARATADPNAPDATVRYAAGMAAHPQLAQWARSPQVPAQLRERCRWWLQHGPAVRR